nr:putative integron gene cassette protein [uncultured bacterium]
MKSAIIIIDLQKGLFEQAGKPFDYDNVISKINRLSQTAREHKIPVLFVQHETAGEPLKHGSNGWALVDELIVKSTDHVVRKTTPNSFLRTNLEELLKSETVENIIVCGYATEFCVDSTIRAGAALGYQIQIVSDAHTTHNKAHASAETIIEHHNKTLSNIKSFGVEIKASESIEIIKKIG